NGCADGSCSPPAPTTGACCAITPACFETTADDCACLGGVYLGDGTLCSDGGCGGPAGTATPSIQPKGLNSFN
ncbi:MAG: hypothetical protein ACYTF9_09690, partial [Planctomycetota bacterium]